MSEGTDASDVSLAAETAKSTAAKFSMAVTGFAGTVIFARMLGPERFGAYYLLFSIVKIADLPIEGWATAAKKRFSEVGTKTGEVIGGQFIFTLAWISIGSVGAFVATGFLESYTKIPAAAPLMIALLCSEALFVSSERLLQARGLIGIATWIDALRSYVTLGLQLLLVFAGWGVAGMAYGLSVASFLFTPVTLYYVGIRPRIPSLDTLTNQWKYARYSLPGTLFGRVYERFDILLLGYLMGPTVAGWYEVAYKLVTPAKFVAETASSGLMARVSHLTSRGEAIGEDITNVLAYASILAIPIFFGSLVIAEPLVVTVYGGDYAEAASLLVVIALYQIVATQNMVLSQTIYGVDMPRSVMWVSVAAVLINLVLGVTLVTSIGPVGVAFATLAAELLMYASFFLIVKDFQPSIPLLTDPITKQFLSGLFMASVVMIYQIVVQINLISLTLILLSAAIVYFSGLLVISPDIRLTIQSTLSELNP